LRTDNSIVVDNKDWIGLHVEMGVMQALIRSIPITTTIIIIMIIMIIIVAAG